MAHDEHTESDVTTEKEGGEERRVSLSITVRPSTRARLEVAASKNNNTISRVAEMSMLEYLDSHGY